MNDILMPHQASSAIRAWLAGYSGKPETHAPAGSTEIATFTMALRTDAVGLYYSSLISFSEAIAGLTTASFSWSTVKLYYSCFYAVHSLLASNGIALFYHGRTPYTLRLARGERPKKEAGVTHKVVWNVLSRDMANNKLLGDVSGKKAHSWMTELREIANYRECKFYDPFVPNHFSYIDSAGFQSAVSLYLGDRTFLYPFDPDHAAVAFPLECLLGARASLSRIGMDLSNVDKQYIISSCARSGIDALMERAI